MTGLAEAFEALRGALERARIRYAIGGSWASTAFGEPRFTNNVDVLVELTAENLDRLLAEIPATFCFDADEARGAIRAGRPFNVIHMSTVLKFDLFPASAFPIGKDELDRAVSLADTGLSKSAAWFVTPEDIVLAKLYWFRLGGEVSEMQWRDVKGVLRGALGSLDRDYLAYGAAKLQVEDLLDRALSSD